MRCNILKVAMAISFTTSKCVSELAADGSRWDSLRCISGRSRLGYIDCMGYWWRWLCWLSSLVKKKFSVYLQSLKRYGFHNGISSKRCARKQGVPVVCSIAWKQELTHFPELWLAGWERTTSRSSDCATGCASLHIYDIYRYFCCRVYQVSYFYGQNDWQMIQKIGRSTLYAGLIAGEYFLLYYFWDFTDKYQLCLIKVNIIAYSFCTFGLDCIFPDIWYNSGDRCRGLLRIIKDVKIPTLLCCVGLLGGQVTSRLHIGHSSQNEYRRNPWIGFLAGLTISSFYLIFRFLSMQN